MTLYELTGNLLVLQNMLTMDAEDEEYDSAFIEAQLSATAESIAEKSEGYAKIIKNLSAYADACKAEKDRFAKKQKTAENAIARMKQTLQGCMEQIGIDKINTPIGKWSIQSNPYSVAVTDISKVPERFLIPQEPKVNSAAIKDEYKATGEIFDGIEITQSRSLRFR